MKILTKVFFRRKRLKVDGTASIEIEAYHNRKRVYLNSGISIEPKNWSVKQCKIVKLVNADHLNVVIGEVINSIERYEQLKMEHQEDVILSDLRDFILNDKDDNRKVYEFCEVELDRTLNGFYIKNFKRIKTMHYMLFFTVLISCISCGTMNTCKDEELTLKRTEYSGQKLQIDGFYYGNANTDAQGRSLYELFVLYENGILMLPGTIEFSKVEEYVATIANSNQQNTKFVWGLFEVKEISISLEHWVASQCGYPAVLRSGEILNDTTFVFNKMVRRDSQGVKSLSINQEFHFRQLDIKPDSTNNFIK